MSTSVIPALARARSRKWVEPTRSPVRLVLAQFAGSSGTYNLNGGLLTLPSGGMIVGSGTASFNFGGGTLGATAPWSSSMNLNLTGSGGNATVDTTGGNISLTGNLTGAGTLNKVGPGILLLSGTNSVLGSLTVNGGVLQIPGGSLTAATEYVGVLAQRHGHANGRHEHDHHHALPRCQPGVDRHLQSTWRCAGRASYCARLGHRFTECQRWNAERYARRRNVRRANILLFEFIGQWHHVRHVDPVDRDGPDQWSGRLDQDGDFNPATLTQQHLHRQHA